MNRKPLHSKKVAYNFIWVQIILIGYGLLFIVGGIFGYIQFQNTAEKDSAFAFLLAFTLCGGIPFLIGLILLVRRLRKQMRRSTLKEQQLPRSYPVHSVEFVQNIRINQRYPLQLECHIPQPNGDIYILKSDYLKFDPQPYLIDNKVLLYQDPNNPKNYFLDVDGSMANNFYEL